MIDKKLGDTKFGVKPESKLKEVEFYKEPKEGDPKFIIKEDKSKSKALPKWGID